MKKKTRAQQVFEEQEEFEKYERERNRAEHLRNLQRGMIGNVEPVKEKKTFIYACICLLLIAGMAWVIKLTLF